jgi:prepilin signal peptidase PulO-like enzyme (type II secretory pathway)
MMKNNFMYALLSLPFGLILGSFAGAMVYRIKNKLKLGNDRSRCDSCKKQLGVVDLIPLLSWVALRGRCRFCKAKIGVEAPMFEVLTAALLAFSTYYWPYGFDKVGTFTLLVWLLTLAGLVIMTVYDFKWLILPDKVMYPLIYLGIGAVVLEASYFGLGTDRIKAAVLGIAVGGGIFYFLHAVSKGRWIGGGDVKLGVLMGLHLGPKQALLAIYSAAILGSLYVAPLYLRGKAKRGTQVPFGPFLIAGLIIAKLFGASLIKWYERKYLLIY